jgi:hypothetical protein
MVTWSNELSRLVIQPTLDYLRVGMPAADVLESMVLLSSNFGGHPDGLGLYGITPAQHRDIWDNYLAFRPDLASDVRGLASQRRFLELPDLELIANLAYATAIAWLMLARSDLPLPAADDCEAQVRLWQHVFGQVGPRPDSLQIVAWLRRRQARAA